MSCENKEDAAYAVVKKCDTLPEANIIMGLLTGNGIECFISDTSFADLFPANPVNRGLLEVRVRIEDELKALDILNAKFDENDLSAEKK